MMGVTWTTEQEQVIRLRDRNILVSAAAGSGKTAVLVERIITRLTKDIPPVDIDRLLVVTYTEAAAAEMKERILLAIEKKLAEQPGNVHLQRQATLIHSALITTIHSFCLSVIREYFHTIDIDPGFRIGEEGELKLLKHDVIGEVLEAHFASGEASFLEFVECFASGKDDKKLEELILNLYEFSRSNVDPAKWLLECADQYRISNIDELEVSTAASIAYKRTKQIAEDAGKLLEEGKRLCQSEDGPYMYEDALESDMGVIQSILNVSTFAEINARMGEIKWERLASNRDKNVSSTKAELVKVFRGEVKDMISDLQKQYYSQSTQDDVSDMKQAHTVASVLVLLVQEFADAFAGKKQQKNMIDFGDMERFALRILVKRGEHGLEPTDAAKDYRERFAEVMIDEYQDSNLVQEAILTSVAKVTEQSGNVFMVGDVKQSIYRFRLSRPELFLEKYHTYKQTDSAKQRIDLHKNFRSRGEVLLSANFIFEQIMTEALGGISYDEKAALYEGAVYQEQQGNETELLLIHTDGEETKDSDKEVEARVIAAKIKELVGHHPVFDKKMDCMRPARFEDVVILTRSLKGYTDTFQKVLGEEGVPIYTGTKEGYFDTPEIRLILDYLKVLDNKRQDIPLAAVLKSPLGGLNSEELACIRAAYKEQPFHQAVFSYYAGQTKTALGMKLKSCLEQLEAFRKRVPYTAIHDLLYLILEETGYGIYVQAMPGGQQRRANLDMLLEKAKTFENTSYKGLFNFVRYMEQLKKYDVDYGEANIMDEHANVVRMMSIHKSKGLEFPIVFAAGLSKRFNMQDTRSSIVTHPDLGIGIDAVDMILRTKAATLLKKVIQKELGYESMAEELRVLYVALTRAKEKLILTATVPDMEKKIRTMESVRMKEERELGFGQLTKANCYLDWVLPSFIRHSCAAPILEKYGVEVPFTGALYKRQVPIMMKEIFPEELVFSSAMEVAEEQIERSMIEAWDTGKVYDKVMQKQILRQFGFVYPYEEAQKLKQKFTVSELKKRAYLEEEAGEILYGEAEVIPLLPKFLQEEEVLQGASRGTAYHKVLELLDYSRSYDERTLAAEISSFCKGGSLNEKMADCIKTEDILLFLQSDLGRRMHLASESQKVKKEQPFVLGVDANEIYKGLLMQETLLVQGIIDAYFEEENELVVLDYKTDKVRTPEELTEKYHMQLTYYARALEQLTGKKVKEKWIYSFALQKEIRFNK